MAGAGKLAPQSLVLVALGLGGWLEGSPSQGPANVRVIQEDPQQSHGSQPVQLEQGDAKAFIEKQVPPKYPEKAREMRIQGTVVLNVKLSKKGKVKEISVISGHPLLVPAAIDAVKQWKYKPYRVEGHSVEAQTEVVVNFALQN